VAAWSESLNCPAASREFPAALPYLRAVLPCLRAALPSPVFEFVQRFLECRRAACCQQAYSAPQPK